MMDQPLDANQAGALPESTAAAAPGAAGTASPRVPEAQATAAAVRPAHFQPLHNTSATPGPAPIDLLLDVPLQVTVELGRARLSVRQVLALGAGSVVELDRLAGEPVDVLVNNRLIARGEVVVIDDTFGVRVTDIVRPTESTTPHP